MLTQTHYSREDQGDSARERTAFAGPTQAQVLLDLARNLDTFKTPGNVAYAVLPDEGIAYPTNTTAVRDWLTLEYVNLTGKTPATNALQEAVNWLGANTRRTSATREVATRFAWHDGVFYLDLHGGKVARVRRDVGWDVLDAAKVPVRFTRPRDALPLPPPERGGTLNELRDVLGMDDGDTWVLVAGWLLGALQPPDTDGYPVLALHGEQGTGKSTTTEILRMVCDPTTEPKIKHPKNTDDLFRLASKHPVLTFDNASSMSQVMSDAHCIISTGGADTRRELYSNNDDYVLSGHCAQLFNGIGEIAHRGDLLERSVVLHLPRIRADKRKEGRAIWAAFQAAQPRILGALLDAVWLAINWRDEVDVPGSPSRMRGWEVWVTAAEPALGWELGTFKAAYDRNRNVAVVAQADDNPLIQSILEHLQPGMTWGPQRVSELLYLLNELERPQNAGDQTRTKQQGWPGSASLLSNRLERDAPALEKMGIHVHRGKPTKQGTPITLWRDAEEGEIAA